MLRLKYTLINKPPLLLIVSIICSLLLSFYQNLSAQNQPVRRYGHTLSVDHSGNIYMYGGYTDSDQPWSKTNSINGGALGNLWLWEESKVTWVEKNTAASPPGRYSHNAAFSSADGTDKLYVFFGYGGGANVYGDIWSYNPTSNAWQQEPSTGTVPEGRKYHTSTTIGDGRIVVFGGLVGLADSKDQNLYVYNPANGSWETKSPFPGSYLYGHAAAYGNGKVYFFGGESPFGNSNTLWSYDPTNDQWALVMPNGSLPPARAYCAYAYDQNYFYVLGGSDYNFFSLKDVWGYNYNSNSWTRLDDLQQTSNNSAAAIIKNDQGQTAGLLLFGGFRDGVLSNSTSQISVNPSYTLTTSVSPANSGTINLNPSNQPYTPGTSVIAAAVPANGYKFSRWEGDFPGGQENNASITIVMNSDKNINAVFEQTDKYSVTISIAPAGAQQYCQATATPAGGPYDEGTQVTLRAEDNPAEGWFFKEWTGTQASGNAEFTITMNKNYNETANFVNVTLTTSGAKSHSVICPDSALRQLYFMLPISFEASPDDDWQVEAVTLIPSGTGHDDYDIGTVYLINSADTLFGDKFYFDNTAITAELNPPLQVPKGTTKTINAYYKFSFYENYYAQHAVKSFQLKTGNITAQPLTYQPGLKLGTAQSDSLRIVRVYNTEKNGFAKIQDAINDASTKTGDTCYICRGTYEAEELTINKEIALTSDKSRIETILVAKDFDRATAINIRKNNVKIFDLSIKGTDKSLQSAIHCNSVSNIEIIQNIISAVDTGIVFVLTNFSALASNIFNGIQIPFFLNYSDTNEISQNIITQSNTELYLKGSSGNEIWNHTSDGINLSLNDFSLGNNIHNNKLKNISIVLVSDENRIESNNVQSIRIVNAASNKIINNTIEDSEENAGISILSLTAGVAALNTIKNNVIKNCSNYGISVVSANNTIIQNNTITNNGDKTFTKYSGIFINKSAEVNISNNRIANNGFNGIQIENSPKPIVLNNRVLKHNNFGVFKFKSAGIYLSNSDNSYIHDNVLLQNCTGLKIENSKKVKVGINVINDSFCLLTGISISDSDAEIFGNTISNNDGNGIHLEENSYAEIQSNNIFGNSGYGVDNSTNSSAISADNNWWGSDSPSPGDYSENISISAWLNEPISLVVSKLADTIYSRTNTIDSVFFIIRNLANYEGSVNVEVTDEMGWITPSPNGTYSFADSSGAMVHVYFNVPNSPGTMNKIIFHTNLSNDNSVDASDSVYITTYNPQANRLVVYPDSLTIFVPDTVQFFANVYDQNDHALDSEILWSANGGFINSTGLFGVDEAYGEVVITATDQSTGLTGKSAIITVDQPPVLSSIKIIPAVVQIKKGESFLFSARGYNQYSFPQDITPIWETDGGVIDEGGFFIADTLTGEYYVRVEDTATGISASAIVNIVDVVDVEGGKEIPKHFSVSQNYPNPFNPSTTIQYALPYECKVQLEIFNILGQRIIKLVDQIQSAGLKTVRWDAVNYSSGIYLYRIKALSTGTGKQFIDSKKMLLLH